MALSDFIAVGIVLFCSLLGLIGALKWLMRLILGAAFGLAVLVLIGLLVPNESFDEVSHGIFRQGTVIPYVRQRVGAVGDLMSRNSQSTNKLLVAND